MSVPTLQIGNLVIPTPARIEALTQRYEPIGGQSIFRTITGRAINQETWRKTRIVTTGSGWNPPSELFSLDTSLPMTLKCVAPMARWLAPETRTAPLPQKRRDDAPPWATALVRGQGEIGIPILLSGNTARLGTEALSALPNDALEGFYLWHFPQFEVIALRPSLSVDANGAVFGWELVCEEA